jgi:hypothetical protein
MKGKACVSNGPDQPKTEAGEPPPTDPATIEANRRKAEADAATAKLNQTKAEAELEKARSDRRTSEATALKTERETDEANSPGAKTKREAENQKATAVANKEAATARQEQIAALIPDLSEVKPGALAIDDKAAVYGSALALRALSEAAGTVADQAGSAMDGPSPAQARRWRVLVTSEPDLATSDAVYVDVLTGLDQLIAAAKKLTAPAPAKEPEPAALGAAAIASALAGAVPGVLSLLSAHRTLSTAAVTISDLAAAARTAGALAKRANGTVVHDDFRLLPSGTLHEKLTAVSKKRQELVAAKVVQESKRSLATAELSRARDTIADLVKRLEGASDTSKPDLQKQLEDQRRAVAAAETEVNDAAVRIGLIDGVLTAIDTFIGGLRTVSERSKRSPLATAILREQLHRAPRSPAPETQESKEADDEEDGEEKKGKKTTDHGETKRKNDKLVDPLPHFTHVLLVKAESGSTQQVVDDQPLWWKDRLQVVALVDLTYMLIETTNSAIVAGGGASGEAVARGKIGKTFDIKPVTPAAAEGEAAPVAQGAQD